MYFCSQKKKKWLRNLNYYTTSNAYILDSGTITITGAGDYDAAN